MAGKRLAYLVVPGLVAVLLVLATCSQPFTLSELLDGPDGIELTVTPSAMEVIAGEAVTLQVTGGVPPYTCELSSPLGGIGELLDSLTYTAPIDLVGTATILVSDSYLSEISATVTVLPATGSGVLSISPPSATINTGNSITLVASGGFAPYAFTLSSAIGGAGESLLDNTYTAPNDSAGTAVVTVTDSRSNTATASINVNFATAPTLGLSPAWATVYLGGTIEVSAYGGAPPYAYSLVTQVGGTGENFSASIYTAPSDAVGMATIRVTDSDNNTADSTINVVAAAPLAIVPGSLTLKTGEGFTFDAYGGVPPYSFALTNAVGGTGEFLDGSTYTAPSDAVGTAVITVTDNDEGSVFATVTVEMNGGAALAISPSTVNLKLNDTITLSASGGLPPYTFDLVGPIGGTGEFFTGSTYTAPADAMGTAYVTVTDANSDTADCTINVAPVLALTISPGSVTLNSGGSFVFDAYGGVPPYSFALTGTIGGAGEGLVDSTYTAPADSDGTAYVTVTDNVSDTATAEITVYVPAGPALAVSPSTVSLNLGENITLSASGGLPPYTFDLTSTIGGTGEILAGTTYTAPSDAVGTAVVTVTDANSDTADCTISVSPASALEISPSVLSLNAGNSFVFDAHGGVPPYIYSIFAVGSGAPTIDAGSGAYTAGASTGADTVRVTDNVGTTADAAVTVTSVTSNVDYYVFEPTVTGSTVGGGPATGDFTFENQGSADGAYTVNWSVYVSEDTVVGAGDTLLDSGTASPVESGAMSAAISFAGTWPIPPEDPTSWHVVVAINAADDLGGAANDNATSVEVSVPPPADVDYYVEDVLTTSPVSAGSELWQEFSFTNQGSESGVYSVVWGAYLSTNETLDAGDTPVASGTASPLGPMTNSGSISIHGTPWPALPGVYYLIVDVSAGDDINRSNNYLASDPVTVQGEPSELDYVVTSVTRNYPTVVGGSICGETFGVTNMSDVNGTNDITWKAWASTDTVIDDPGDLEVANGVLSPLAAHDGYTSLAIGGAWPYATGDYYLIIEISSGGEVVTANNTAFSGLFTVSMPPDYTVSSANLPEWGDIGMELGYAGTCDFTVSEVAGEDGSLPITWELFASFDAVLDVGDLPISSGMIGPLAAWTSSEPISIGEAIWPTFGANYTLIIHVSAGDDVEESNDVYVAPLPAYVPEIYFEGAEDNSGIGPKMGGISPTSDVGGSLQGGILEVNELLRIDGTMDDYGYVDTYRIVLGPMASTIEVNAEWSTTFNDIDIYVWDEFNGEWVSDSLDSDSEPSLMDAPAVFSGFGAGSVIYVSVLFTDFHPGTPYAINVCGRP